MFSKKPSPGGKTVRSATFSILGADIAITGNISATADLHIDGKVEGDITCAALVQGESSVVTGGITSESARLAGTVHGSITTRELVVLRTARIHGDVHYDALTIEQGAQVDGRLSPRGPAAAEMPETGEAHLVLASSAS